MFAKSITTATLGLLLSLPISAAEGEAKNRPLTNEDVVVLVQLKTADAAIVQKINDAPQVAFDTSANALVSLAKKGVSGIVLDAMVKRTSPPEGSAATSEPPTAAASQSSTASRLKNKLLRRDKVNSDAPTTSKDSAVEMFLTARPEVPFVELGRVDAGKYNLMALPRSREAINAELKRKATALGADAIVDITEDFANVSGVAVKRTRTK